MRHSNIDATHPIDIRLVLKDWNFSKTCVKQLVRKSQLRPQQPSHWAGLRPGINSGDWAINLLLYIIRRWWDYRSIRSRNPCPPWLKPCSILKKLVKTKFPHIDTFNHEGPAVVNAMRDLTSRVFEHLEFTSPMDAEKGYFRRSTSW